MDNKQSQRTTKSNQVRLPKQITETARRVQPHVSKMWISNVCQITSRNYLHMLIICKRAWYWHTMHITYHYISWRIITLVLDETARRDLQPRPCSGSPSAMTGGKSKPIRQGSTLHQTFGNPPKKVTNVGGFCGCSAASLHVLLLVVSWQSKALWRLCDLAVLQKCEIVFCPPLPY